MIQQQRKVVMSKIVRRGEEPPRVPRSGQAPKRRSSHFLGQPCLTRPCTGPCCRPATWPATAVLSRDINGNCSAVQQGDAMRVMRRRPCGRRQLAGCGCIRVSDSNATRISGSDATRISDSDAVRSSLPGAVARLPDGAPLRRRRLEPVAQQQVPHLRARVGGSVGAGQPRPPR